MKKFRKIFVFIILAVFLSNGCTHRPVKIGFLLHALDKERWENDRDYFVQKVTDMGGTVSVEIADNNAERQLIQARKLMNEGIKVLVIVPVDMFAASEIVKEANDRGVNVISYDRLIMNCKLDYYVSTDNVNIGELQAQYLTTIKPVGNYALIGGAQNDHNSQFLYLGQLNILQPLVEKGDIKIIYKEFTDSWSMDEGYAHTKKILELPEKADAIIAGNDAIALGVIKALEEVGLACKVLVAGMDADLKNLQEILKGTQTITIYKPIENIATTAAELAVKMAECEPCENSYQRISNGEILVPSILHNATVVNKENLKLTVISEGYQKEEEIFK